jgi:acylpyruvate hydrolase
LDWPRHKTKRAIDVFSPSGVGSARKPPVLMKGGDVCEVEIERIGTLRNRIVYEEGTRVNAA